jgi:hypothetical protein
MTFNKRFLGFFYISWLIIHYKILNFLKWVWSEAKDFWNLVFIILWWLLLCTPVWVGYALYFITQNAWHLTYANACIVFWAGPFTPLVPLAICLGIGTRQAIKKIFKKSK